MNLPSRMSLNFLNISNVCTNFTETGFENTAEDICAVEAANPHRTGAEGVDGRKGSSSGSHLGTAASEAEGTGHAAGWGLCLPEAASRSEDSSDSRCRKI